MIFGFPTALSLPKSSEQSTALHFLPNYFDKKGATTALADKTINFSQQIFRENYMSSFLWYRLVSPLNVPWQHKNRNQLYA